MGNHSGLCLIWGPQFLSFSGRIWGAGRVWGTRNPFRRSLTTLFFPTQEDPVLCQVSQAAVTSPCPTVPAPARPVQSCAGRREAVLQVSPVLLRRHLGLYPPPLHPASPRASAPGPRHPWAGVGLGWERGGGWQGCRDWPVAWGGLVGVVGSRAPRALYLHFPKHFMFAWC